MSDKPKSRWLLPILCVCLAALAALFIFRRYQSEHEKRLSDYDISVFSVLLGSADGFDPDSREALLVCPRILAKLRYGEEKEWTEELYAPIHTLMEQFYEYGYLPREPYEGVGDYVTSMDAPLLAVTAEMAYERSGDSQFRQYMEDLIPYIVSDTTQNGFVLKLSDTEWWPLEYAWKDVTEDDAWFVYNGSLFGMVCIQMLEELTGDERLTELSEKALNAYRTRADQYLYPDGAWCYYDLRCYYDPDSVPPQKTINTIVKLLIESQSLYALYQLTEESFYLEQYELRQDLLKEILPVYVVSDGTTNTAMLLRACAPHPYMVETYRSTLEFLDADGKVIATAEENSRAVDGSYIKTEVPDGVVSYRLYGLVNPIEKTLLVEAPVTFLTPEDLEPTVVEGSWTCDDAHTILQDQHLTISPNPSEVQQARLYFKPDSPISYDEETFLILELNNHSEEILPMRGAFYYESGEYVPWRVLETCRPGKNLQIINYMGLRELVWPLEDYGLMQFVLVADPAETSSIDIDIGNLYVCRNTAQVVEYLSQRQWAEYWVEAE